LLSEISSSYLTVHNSPKSANYIFGSYLDI
jgi:hypothetical protein